MIDDDPDAARRSLTAIGQVSREALAELARLLAVLDEQTPTPESGLDGTARHLVAGAQAAGLDVDARQTGNRTGALDAAVDRCAYRIVQEGLTNALRHTSDARVTVRARRHGADAGRRRGPQRGTPHASSYGGDRPRPRRAAGAGAGPRRHDSRPARGDGAFVRAGPCLPAAATA